MKILVLDDQAYRHDYYEKRFANTGAEICHAYNPDEAADFLAHELFEVAFLDHDLGYFVEDPYPMEITGLATAKLIATMPIDVRPKRVVVHSWSPSGARMMAETLRDAGVNVDIEPFTLA